MGRLIDTPGVNDNRRYDYASHQEQERKEYPYIVDCVGPGSRVIDLGCGNGSLLKILKAKKGVDEAGIELTQSGVEACKSKGLNVRQGRIDVPLDGIQDKSFDYAICNVTIQMVMFPEVLLTEMKRIARYQIVSFPNFAHWLNRLDLLLKGRMPRRMLFGYEWYNTGHIHQFSVRDFEEYVAHDGFTVKERIYFRSNLATVLNLNPNLFATIGIYTLMSK